MSGSVLITPRRNFLIRALGFTAAGASLSVPVLALQSPRERIDHHFKELAAAFQDLYPDRDFTIRKRVEVGEEFAAGPDASNRPGMFANWGAPLAPLALIIG
jgi:hypothetical protein